MREFRLGANIEEAYSKSLRMLLSNNFEGQFHPDKILYITGRGRILLGNTHAQTHPSPSPGLYRLATHSKKSITDWHNPMVPETHPNIVDDESDIRLGVRLIVSRLQNW